MPSPRTCPKCGRPLAAEGAGVCPRCLLGLGLDLGSSFAPGGTGGRSGVLELAGDDLPDALKKARGAPGKSTRGSEAKSELFGSVPGGTDTEPQGRRKKKPGKAGGARPARSKRPSSSKSKRGGEPSADVAPYLATPYRRGDVIGGKYKVYDVLGKGGFGVVYLVYSYEAESVLALKTFRDDLMHDPGARARFMREAQIWVTLGNHPHTVRALFAT